METSAVEIGLTVPESFQGPPLQRDARDISGEQTIEHFGFGGTHGLTGGVGWREGRW